uniref:Uncharacterized protein n=1 Tax=candidate division WOR-3 bacterium TaxID=2052148 RepID=A0A7V4E3S4_UNCW3
MKKGIIFLLTFLSFSIKKTIKKALRKGQVNITIASVGDIFIHKSVLKEVGFDILFRTNHTLDFGEY